MARPTPEAPNAAPSAGDAGQPANMRRRTALKAMGAGAALAAAAPFGEAQAAPSGVRQVKARFQPDAAEVKTFYRVNRYL